MLAAFLGGANMLMTGVLGVYVGRIYAEVKRRPLYVVDKTVGFEAAAARRDAGRGGDAERACARDRREARDARRSARRRAALARSARSRAGGVRPSPGAGDLHRRHPAAMPLRPARRRLVADHRRREMARRRDALRRLHRDQPARFASSSTGRRSRWRASSASSRNSSSPPSASSASPRPRPRLGGAQARRPQRSLRPLAQAIALVVFAVLPGHSFDERDHLAAVFGAPFLAVAAARAARAPVHSLLAVARRPRRRRDGGDQTALCAGGDRDPALSRGPARLRARCAAAIEYGAAAALGSPIWRSFPSAFLITSPTCCRSASPSTRRSASRFGALLAAPGALLTLALGAAAAKLAGRRLGEPLVAIPALAALGAFAAYLIQGKGGSIRTIRRWPTSAWPPAAALAIGPQPRGGRKSARSPPSSPRWRSTPSASSRSSIALRRRRRGGASSPERREASPRRAAVRRNGRRRRDRRRRRAVRHERRRDADDRARAGEPRPASHRRGDLESLAFGHPMTRAVGGVWVQSVPSLWITSAVRRLIDEHPHDAALAGAPSLYRQRSRKAGRGPEAKPARRDPGRQARHPLPPMGVERPQIAAARADYRFFAVEPGTDFPAELYVRKDLIGLAADAPGRRGGAPTAGQSREARRPPHGRGAGTRINFSIESQHVARSGADMRGRRAAASGSLRKEASADADQQGQVRAEGDGPSRGHAGGAARVGRRHRRGQ